MFFYLNKNISFFTVQQSVMSPDPSSLPSSTGIDGVLEIFNGLFIIFICSEGLLRYSKHNKNTQQYNQNRSQEETGLKIRTLALSTLKTHVQNNDLLTHYVLPWTALNFLVWCGRGQLAAWLSTPTLTDTLGVLLSPFQAILEVVGGTMLFWLMLMLLAVALRVLVFKKKTHEPFVLMQLSTWSQELFYVTGISLLCLTVRELGFDTYIQHTEMIKVSVLLVLSALLLFVDANRYTNNQITLKEYGHALSQALIYAFLALPVAAVLISCFFLILTSALQKLGADPEHSSLVNLSIYYGVLYGPLYVVYWHAKRSLIAKKSALPWYTN